MKSKWRSPLSILSRILAHLKCQPLNLVPKFSMLVVVFVFFSDAHCCADYAYQVEFQGISDKTTIAFLQEESELLALIDKPPLTAAGIQVRIDDEIAILLKALQSKAYYNASIKASVDNSVSPILITLFIETGPIYTFTDFFITPNKEGQECLNLCNLIDLEEIGIEIGAPAYPTIIIEAEDLLLESLENLGFPLAKIINREVKADVSNHTVSVNLLLNCGQKGYFGETKISGNEDLLPIFFYRKIAWQEGEIYHPELVKRTLNALELSGLFSSITLTHADEVNEDGLLPMYLNIKEAKQRSIAFGIGYATDLGAGVNGEWEHRNLSGTGDKLSCVVNLWQIKQQGFIRYIQPDFLRPRQDLIWALELEHEDVKAFREASFTFSGTIERQINDQTRLSIGGMFTRLRNTHSDNNGTFTLFKVPFQLFWNGANHLMDPTSGGTILFKTTPALQVQAPCFAYTTHLFTATAYYPLSSDHRYVLAAKATLGSIWGANKHAIPSSERFYAGSDTLLRGYHYLTVSPLNEFNKPIGGRSLMIYSLEARMRIKDPFGLVLFYDLGNVYSESLPQFRHQQLQSAGIGFRYHTPVGPIRLDVAFPFNPRKHLDGTCQIYFSIGQSF